MDEWICDYAFGCTNAGCDHREPHEKKYYCCIRCLAANSPGYCIPYKGYVRKPDVILCHPKKKYNKALDLLNHPYKEEKMEIEIIKPFSCREVFKDMRKDCFEVFMDRWDHCLWNQEINEASMLMELQENHDARQWALTHGFIRKKKAEVFYKIGDRFRWQGDTYLLACAGPKKVCLVSLGSGSCVQEATTVGDVFKITEDEFNQITYGHKLEKIN